MSCVHVQVYKKLYVNSTRSYLLLKKMPVSEIKERKLFKQSCGSEFLYKNRIRIKNLPFDKQKSHYFVDEISKKSCTIILRVSNITANLYHKSRNLPNTDVRNYSIDLR